MSNYDENLRQRVLKLLASGEITQAELARKIGYASAAISLYKNGNYGADAGKLEQSLREYFDRNDVRKETRTPVLTYGRRDNYIPTTASTSAYKLIRYAQIEKKLVVIYGDTGVGKTKAAYKFADDNPNNTVYITSSPSAKTLRSTLKMIAREIRLPVCRTDDLAYNVRQKLQDGEKTLIIDEAQNLTVSVVNEISRWVDPDPITGEAKMAIVLIGNDGVLEKFDGTRDERRNQNLGRMCLNMEIRSIKTTKEDVRQLFPALAESGMDKELDLLFAVSRGITGIRAAVEIYNSAVNAGRVDYDTLYRFAARKKAVAI